MRSGWLSDLWPNRLQSRFKKSSQCFKLPQIPAASSPPSVGLPSLSLSFLSPSHFCSLRPCLFLTYSHLFPKLWHFSFLEAPSVPAWRPTAQWASGLLFCHHLTFISFCDLNIQVCMLYPLFIQSLIHFFFFSHFSLYMEAMSI